MGQLVVTAAGAAIGNAILPGIGGQFGAILGSALGSALFGENQSSQGPRLDELRVSGTEYGQAIPWSVGTPRLAGQIWWASDRRETATTQSVGKGGGASSTSYTYDVDLLVGLNDGQIGWVSRVWVNGKLVYNVTSTASSGTIANSVGTDAWKRISFYTGSSTQLPDPTYEAAVGVGNAPAYRGRAYAFIEGLQLGNSGQIPNITFELAASAQQVGTVVLLLPLDIDTGINDQSAAPKTMAYVGSGITLSTASSKFGGAALQFTTGGGAVRVSHDAALNPGSQDFTMEMWFLYKGPIVNASTRVLFSRAMDAYGPFGSFLHAYTSERGDLQVYAGWALNNFVSFSSGPGGITPDEWMHLAIVRTGNTLRGYINGVQFGSVGFSNAMYNSLQPLYIGNYDEFGNGLGWQGGIDCIRYTVGAALYTANFTPSTQPLGQTDTLAVMTPLPTVQATVERLCARAGMQTAHYDASALSAITRPVRALSIGQIGNARGVLEQLATAYQFEAVTSDKLYFVPRGGAVEATIPYADLGAGEDQPQAEPLALQISSDLELPPQVAVSYRNAAADYQTATEMSDRLISGQAAISTVQLGMALLPSEAKIAADAMVADQLAGLVTSTIHLPLQYAKVQPTSVVQVTDATGALQRMRIVRRTDAGGVLTCEVVADDAQAVVSTGTTDATYTASSAVSAIATTLLYAWDMPLLRDTDDTPGYYVSARGNDAVWPGAIALTSNDNATFTQAATVAESAVMGSATSALGAWTGGAVFDEVNTVTVSVGTGTLSSVTRDALLQGRTTNAMIIGSEVVKFMTAALQSTNPNVYKLSGLLRGQLGTEWAQAGHASGERVALITTQGWRRVAQTTDDRNRLRYLKGVTNGRSVADTQAATFTNSGISSAPLAPVDARIDRATNGDVTLTWKRRTRYTPTFAGPSGISVPLDAPAELYDVEFYRSSSFEVIDAVGSVLGVTEPTITRTYYDMFVSNGLTAPTAIYAKIYQRNGSLRGRALTVSATLPSTFANLGGVAVAATPAGEIIVGSNALVWRASAPDDTYSVVRSDGYWNAYGGRIAQTATQLLMIFPSSVLNFVGDRNKTVVVTAPLDLSAPFSVITTSPYFTTPRAVVGDGSRFLLIGEGDKVYSSSDLAAWTLLGTMSGAAFPVAIGSDEATNQRLLKIGSRWFLIFVMESFSGASINCMFYSDDPDAVTGWTASTGINISGNASLLDDIVSDGTYLYAVRSGFTGGSDLCRSADNGASWIVETSVGVNSAYFRALQCTGSTAGVDKVRFYGPQTTFEKFVGSVTWTSKPNNLVSAAKPVKTPSNRMVVTDFGPPFSGANPRVLYETDGVFAPVGPF